jgi:hypothetical protein
LSRRFGQASAGLAHETGLPEGPLLTLVTAIPSRARAPVDQAGQRQHVALTVSLLGRDVLAFHPALTRVTGSITAGLMLSQSLYWTRVLMEQQRQPNEWFWKTHRDWETEIALSKHEQITARKRLSALPFWHEQRRGTHGRMHFRVDLDALATHLDRDFTGHWSWHDRQQVLSLLGRSVLVFRPLADLCQSVTAAILLSHYIGMTRQALRTGHDAQEWQVHRFDELRQLTGLTRDELNHARHVLRKLGYMRERLVGAPPRAQWCIDFPVLLRALKRRMDPAAASASETRVSHDGMPLVSHNRLPTPVVDQFASFPQDSLLVSSKLENPAIESISDTPDDAPVLKQNPLPSPAVTGLSGIRTTEDTKSVQQTFGNPHNITDEIPKVCCTDSRFPNKGLTTGKPITTPTLLPPKSSATELASGGGGLLLHAFPANPADIDFPASPKTGQQELGLGLSAVIAWPHLLLPDERVIATRMLANARVMHLAQTLVDELAGQHAVLSIRQPLAYLRKLVAQAIDGSFVASAAPRVAAQRAQYRQRVQEDQQQRSVAAATISTDEQREARRLELTRMRAALLGHRPLGAAHPSGEGHHH